MAWATNAALALAEGEGGRLAGEAAAQSSSASLPMFVATLFAGSGARPLRGRNSRSRRRNRVGNLKQFFDGQFWRVRFNPPCVGNSQWKIRTQDLHGFSDAAQPLAGRGGTTMCCERRMPQRPLQLQIIQGLSDRQRAGLGELGGVDVATPIPQRLDRQDRLAVDQLTVVPLDRHRSVRCPFSQTQISDFSGKQLGGLSVGGREDEPRHFRRLLRYPTATT